MIKNNYVDYLCICAQMETTHLDYYDEIGQYYHVGCRSGLGFTKALFVNFSIRRKCLLESLNHIHIWQVSPQRWLLSNMNVTSVFMIEKRWENNRMDQFVLVTPTLGTWWHLVISGNNHDLKTDRFLNINVIFPDYYKHWLTRVLFCWQRLVKLSSGLGMDM